MAGYAVRPKVLRGFTEKVVTGCGNLYVTVNGNSPIEVFAVLGKQGGCSNAQLEGITRLISANLRSGVSLDKVIEQLVGISCPNPMMFPEGDRVLSCPDAIGKVLTGFLKGKEIED